MNDRHVAELVEGLTPDYNERSGDWEAVLHDARRRRLRRWPLRAAVAFAVSGAVAVAVLAWPFQGQQGGVLERALAAIGDGPVLHVVLRDEVGGTLVDLRSGERQPVHGENEVWYDIDRGLVHSISRFGDVVQHEEVYEPKEPPTELRALAREYRQALESGTARVAGEGVVEGEAVTWITIRSELLPDVADGRDHEWAQQVAVSGRTFRPVALRETRDGLPGPGTGQRVLELGLLPAGAGDFTTSEADRRERVFSQGREPIALEEAHAILGRAPLWLGREHAGLPLGAVFRETTRSGRREEIRITGAEALAALACTRLRGEEAGRCFRALGRHPVTVRPDGVYKSSGPLVWDDEQQAVVLFYGTLGDDPSTYRKDSVPLFDRPHVTITETAAPSTLRRGVGAYVPSEGSVLLAAGARTGFLEVGGVHVSIEAPDEEAVLVAARSLHPMPK